MLAMEFLFPHVGTGSVLQVDSKGLVEQHLNTVEHVFCFGWIFETFLLLKYSPMLESILTHSPQQAQPQLRSL